jgi:pimeloyl-ACP methyl ester carboxylesterase
MLPAACAGPGPYRIDLMPAPDIYDDGRIDPLPSRNPFELLPYGGMLYATDREPATEEHRERFYRNSRGFLLRLGMGEIDFGPEGIDWEEARRISLLKNRAVEYPVTVTDIDELGVLASSYSIFTAPLEPDPEARLPAERFAGLVNEKLAMSKRKDVFIYVPGYKVVFENPLLVATELWHFLGYDGVFIAFAWPSTPKSLAYFSDIETASLSAHTLRLLIEYLAGETDAERIHIVGYSAGTRVVLNALFQMALAGEAGNRDFYRQSFRLGNVILVGSDFDRGLFGAFLHEGLLNVPERLTVYLSEADKALGISRFFFRRERLGQMWKDRELAPGALKFIRQHEELTLIDVTGAEEARSGNGHDYFRRSPWVSSDILMTLYYNLPPAERGLETYEKWPVWHFPPGYIDELRKDLERRHAED